MIGSKARGGARACGEGRILGGIYLECGLSPFGEPMESFWMDPPLPLPLTVQAQVTPLGMSLWEAGDGTHHVLDWIGESHYPYVPDFLEEARVMGFSRRAPKTLDFSKLGPGSRMIYIHKRARVANHLDFAPYLPDFECPCGKGHLAGDSCIGLLWHVAPADPKVLDTVGRALKIKGKDSYPLLPLTKGAPAPVYEVALFASMPITSVSVVAGTSGYDKLAYEKASLSSLPVDVVNK